MVEIDPKRLGLTSDGSHVRVNGYGKPVITREELTALIFELHFVAELDVGLSEDWNVAARRVMAALDLGLQFEEGA